MVAHFAWQEKTDVGSTYKNRGRFRARTSKEFLKAEDDAVENKRQVINFPPKIDCPACGTRLRPASRRELNADLRDRDPVRRQLALSAAQGARDWEPPGEFPEWLKDITPPASWLFRCDGCGNRTLWSREDDTA
jgi:hypothetical protein